MAGHPFEPFFTQVDQMVTGYCKDPSFSLNLRNLYGRLRMEPPEVVDWNLIPTSRVYRKRDFCRAYLESRNKLSPVGNPNLRT